MFTDCPIFHVRRKLIAVIIAVFFFLSLFLISCLQNQSEKKENHPEESLSGIHTLPGFKVDLLYEAPKETQGTWVSLSIDESGRMIASDQYDKGMYQIDILTDEKGKVSARVEKLNLPVTGAQGLTWYKRRLYANVNGKGIFRIRESGKDTLWGEPELLGGPESPSEHGNHSLVPAPDSSVLYVVNGNHTPLPKKYASRVLNWQEDILLPRQWDAQGHAAGIFAPGGYVARIDEDAKNWDILSVGYRNQYDIAFHPNGEIFTFDSDMEWDMGMPWYRPTRILHVVSGSDYGWRSGSGKWKDFYEDSHPAVLDVGPASPTGVLFGTGARFPVKYQHAFFGLDWTYGTIYAFHLKPQGASYTATAEEFISGKPLAVVDAVIGKDGAMYFITGGWYNETKLYRVTYTGSESTDPVQFKNDEGNEARKLRHQLESFHGQQDMQAVAFAWPYLADEDRFIRNAARVAIEFQPVQNWMERLKAETRPQAAITGTVALARAGKPVHLQDALQTLGKLNFQALNSMQKLGYLRALSLTFMRLGEPDIEEKHQWSNRLLLAIGDADERVNVELVRLLVRLKDERVIAPALNLIQHSPKTKTPDWGGVIRRNNSYGGTVQRLLDNPPPANQLEYLFMLRNIKSGWTLDQRKTYFSMINSAADAMGGESYWGFLERMRDEALLGISDSMRIVLGDLIRMPISKAPPFEIKPVKGPGKNWTVDESFKEVSNTSDRRNFEEGRNAFFAVGCASCHRFDGMGGNIGPDLGSVGNRFSIQKILEDIIHPSQTVSDLYGSSKVRLTGGRSLEGLVVKDEGFIKVYSRNPDQSPEIISLSEVAAIEPVSISQMPEGLINGLNADELRSLIAYLISGGDRKHQVFQ